MGQLYKHHVQLGSHHFVTGTWTYAVPTTASPKAGGLWAKAATDETSTVIVPFGLPGCSRGLEAKVKAVTIPIIIGTAALDAVITATLTRYDDWAAPPIVSQTFTAAVNGSLITFATAMLPAGTAVTVSTSGALPTGLATSTTYYVGYQDPTNPTISTGQLYTTLGAALAAGPAGTGDLVAFTSAGTGTQTIVAANVTATNVPITLTGAQVTANAQWRELKATVTTPEFTATNDYTGLKDATTYALIASFNAAATTVVSVSELPWVEYEEAGLL